MTPRFLSLSLYNYSCPFVPPKQILQQDCCTWCFWLTSCNKHSDRLSSLHHQANPIPNPSLGPYTYEPISLAWENPAANPSQSVADTFSVSFTWANPTANPSQGTDGWAEGLVAISHCIVCSHHRERTRHYFKYLCSIRKYQVLLGRSVATLAEEDHGSDFPDICILLLHCSNCAQVLHGTGFQCELGFQKTASSVLLLWTINVPVDSCIGLESEIVSSERSHSSEGG